MKRILLLLVITFALSGCSSHSELVSQHNEEPESYLGLTTADLVRIKGAPGSVVVLGTGESVWTYKVLKTSEKKGAGGAAGNSGSNQPVLSWVETVSFIIDSNSAVKSYTTAVEYE